MRLPPPDAPRRAGESAAVRFRARGIRVVRGGRIVVRDIDLDVDAGQVVGLLGPSGAGKSTFFSAITGESDADGEVLLDGQSIANWPLWQRARAGVGYIPQQSSVLWGLTVRANLATFRRVVGLDASDAAVEEAAARVELAGRLDVRAGELSAGERRRLDFARAVTRPPRLLVCDEPFAGVDPAGAEHLGNMLRDLASTASVAVLLADHHVSEALRICSRALLLLDGTIAAEGAPGTFREHALVRGRYLGSWDRTIPPTR